MRRDNNFPPATIAPTSNSGEKLRYSDKELEEFRMIILEKLKNARQDLVLLNESVKDSDDPASKEDNFRLAERQKKFIGNLENAMDRINNKTYGICRVTGKLISKERLRSVPHATLSVEGKIDQGPKDKKDKIIQRSQQISALLDKPPVEAIPEPLFSRM